MPDRGEQKHTDQCYQICKQVLNAARRATDFHRIRRRREKSMRRLSPQRPEHVSVAVSGRWVIGAVAKVERCNWRRYSSIWTVLTVCSVACITGLHGYSTDGTGHGNVWHDTTQRRTLGGWRRNCCYVLRRCNSEWRSTFEWVYSEHAAGIDKPINM